MRCSVKTCQSKSGPGSGIHFFQFPLRDKKRLDKWIAAVGKPNWRPIKTSRICSLHFNEADIIRNVGYQRVYLREHAVPKNGFSLDVEKEQTEVEVSKLKEVCNIKNVNDVDSSKTSVLSKYVIHEHNYSILHNIFLRIENARSSIFSIPETCESIEKKILNQDEKHEFIHVTPNIFPRASTASNSGDENDLANMGKIVKKLSKNVELLKRQNKTLKQKLRRHKKRIASMKQMFDRL